MTRPFRTLVAAAVLCAPLAAAAPARAETGGFALFGTGTYEPGLPCPAPTGCAERWETSAFFFSDIATGFGACTYDGWENHPGGATVLAGSGTGTFSCTGGATVSGTLTYQRTGGYLTARQCLVVNGRDVEIDLHGVQVLGPPPFTTFRLFALVRIVAPC